jgi:hypothetical protein
MSNCKYSSNLCFLLKHTFLSVWIALGLSTHDILFLYKNKTRVSFPARKCVIVWPLLGNLLVQKVSFIMMTRQLQNLALHLNGGIGTVLTLCHIGNFKIYFSLQK